MSDRLEFFLIRWTRKLASSVALLATSCFAGSAVSRADNTIEILPFETADSRHAHGIRYEAADIRRNVIQNSVELAANAFQRTRKSRLLYIVNNRKNVWCDVGNSTAALIVSIVFAQVDAFVVRVHISVKLTGVLEINRQATRTRSVHRDDETRSLETIRRWFLRACTRSL